MRRTQSLTLVIALLAAPAWSQASRTAEIARARQLVESERAAEAAELLRSVEKKGNADAEAFLLLSTAEFMLGNIEAGRTALESSLEQDPTYRQAWLTRAALDMSEDRLDEALEAMQKAAELDPTALDNDLNIGAVYILKDEVGQASRHFNRYLTQNRSSANAYYLVATNYAIAARWDLATQHLQAAVGLDERIRRRARTDPNFTDMAQYSPFDTLLKEDSYRAPSGAYIRSKVFDEPFDGARGKLLSAVLNALQFSDEPFDPNVELTEDWALIWSDIRIKVTDTPDGRGQINLIAPAERMTAAHWQERSDQLFSQVEEQLAMITMRRQKRPPAAVQ
jgi:tetratricopeptide (TPR) repeat protein